MPGISTKAQQHHTTSANLSSLTDSLTTCHPPELPRRAPTTVTTMQTSCDAEHQQNFPTSDEQSVRDASVPKRAVLEVHKGNP
jgi:hypothetical protein